MDTSNKTLMDGLRTWFATWGDWMQAEAQAHQAQDPYWLHVRLIFSQLGGLVSGHNENCKAPCLPLELVH